ncbi:HlyD family efflux transporter periplasmic adaptor subunit [Pedobacter borealis]|uniref:HlyD family efflux transporter periplasmic adaptor subunit n=1 Tax=Pedobacter borealis TaxID=475254 RepID=UPI000493AFB9|nr:HlyD family efflux transporter periplasmic adaptor subunit [Pedobacter borealis]
MPDNLKLRSEVAQEIVTRKPDFTERWAILVFLFLILLIFSLTWYIKYPITVQAAAVLSSTNSPKEILTNVDGKIKKLIHTTGDFVVEGDPIAWIKTTSDHEQVLKLDRLLDSGILFLERKKELDFVKLFRFRFKELGDLQEKYEQFLLALNLYRESTSSGFFPAKRNLLMKDLDNLKRIGVKIDQQLQIAKDDEQIALTSFIRMQGLFDKKVVSKLDLENEKISYFKKQAVIPQLQQSKYQNSNTQSDKLQEINQMNFDITARINNISEIVYNLRSEIMAWKEKYIISSSISGHVEFIVPVQQNQNFDTHSLLGYVYPSKSKIVFNTYLPQSQFGKIKEGQEVQLRLDAYPFEENGIIKGHIERISKIATDKGFLAIISLQNGLKTSSNFVIPYRTGLTAQALIITKDMRLLERLYYNFLKKNNIN